MKCQIPFAGGKKGKVLAGFLLVAKQVFAFTLCLACAIQRT